MKLSSYQISKIETICTILENNALTIQEASSMADKALEPVRDRLRNLGINYGGKNADKV